VKHSNIYCTGHVHSQVVCESIAKGTGFKLVPPAPLLDGGVIMYGYLRGLLPTLHEARAKGRQWVYADRGYFRATYGNDYSGYFRLTRNAWQTSGFKYRPDPKRWERLLLNIAPWRHGRHVLVCPPGDPFTRAVGGFDADQWLADVLKRLQSSTDRPIRIRRKPKPGSGAAPLAMDLQDCHALVTYMSNTAVEAVLAGVPVFTTGACAATVMGKTDLTQIENPAYPDTRLQLAQSLACNQWTLDEIKRGLANEVFA
jgi:hypothetical protein